MCTYTHKHTRAYTHTHLLFVLFVHNNTNIHNTNIHNTNIHIFLHTHLQHIHQDTRPQIKKRSPKKSIRKQTRTLTTAHVHMQTHIHTHTHIHIHAYIHEHADADADADAHAHANTHKVSKKNYLRTSKRAH